MTLSLAKLKIEILNNLGEQMFASKPNLEILEKLMNANNQVLALDNFENIQGFLSNGVHFDEVKIKNQESNFKESKIP